jgi:hypothetical protein
MIFENRMLRRTFGRSRNGESGDWRGNLYLLLFIKYNLNDQVKDDEIDRTFSTHGG